MDVDKTKQKILIVDDTISVIAILKEIILRAGYQVAIATSGEKALRKLSVIKPDLILLDVMMPGLNGYQTCEAIKVQKEFEQVPIIFISALNESFDKVKAFKSGAIDYVPKPVNGAELLMRINVHLKIANYRNHVDELNLQLEEKVKKRTKVLDQRNKELLDKNLQLDKLTHQLLYEKDNLDLIINSASLGTFEVNVETGYAKRNAIAAAMIGYSLEELGNTNEFWLSRVHPDDSEIVKVGCSNHNVEGFDIHYRMQHRLGHWVWVQCKGKATKRHDNNAIFLSGIIMDITERKASREALENSEKRFRLLSEYSSEAIFIHYKGNIVECNKAFASLMNVSDPKKLYNTPIPFDRILPEYQDLAINNMTKHLSGKFETEVLRSNGSIFDVEIETNNIYYKGKEMRLVAIRDISLQKNTIRLSERRLKILEVFEHSSLEQLLIKILDDIQALSKSEMCFLIPYKEAVFYNTVQTYSSVVANKLDQQTTGMFLGEFFKNKINECLLNKQAITFEFPNDVQEESLFQRALLYPVVRENIVVSIVFVANKPSEYIQHDISILDQTIDWYRETSERKRTEEELQKSEQRFANVFNSSETAMLLIDPESNAIVQHNKAAQAMYQMTKAELDNKKFFDLCANDSNDVQADLCRVLKHELSSMRYTQVMSDASVKEVDVFFSIIDSLDKQLIFTIIIDRSASVKAKNELLKVNQRLNGLDNIVHYHPNSINDLMDYAVHQVIEYTGSQFGYVYEYSQEKNVFLLNNYTEEVPLVLRSEDQQTGQVACIVQSAHEKKTVLGNAINNLIKGDDKQPIYSASIPILNKEEVVGVMWIAKADKQFDLFDVEQMELLLETTWLLVEKQKLQDELDNHIYQH